MYRLVRWVGTPSAFQDPLVKTWILAGSLSAAQVEDFRRYEYHLRVSLSPGAVRTLSDRHGYGQLYTFTPEAPYQWMLEADAEKLFGSRWDRWEFLDLTDHPAPRTAVRTMRKNDWRQLMDDFKLLTTNRRDNMVPGKSIQTRVLRP